MRILLESAALDAIRWGFTARLADGVFVTPSALDTDAFGIDPVAQVESISRLATAPIIVAVGAVTADDLHRKGRELAKISDQVIVALPFVEDGVDAMTKLATEGVRMAATFIVTPAQALLAARVGVGHVCISFGDLESHGQDPTLVIRQTRALFDQHGVECDIAAVQANSSRAMTEALAAGADTVCVTPGTLRSAMQHPLTDRALDQLLGELSRRPRGHAR